jgi:hypothetical protein
MMQSENYIARNLAIGFLILGLVAWSIITLVSPKEYDPSTQPYLDAKQSISTQMLIRPYRKIFWTIAGTSLVLSGICALAARVRSNLKRGVRAKKTIDDRHQKDIVFIPLWNLNLTNKRADQTKKNTGLTLWRRKLCGATSAG